jgi:hypothetical protein
MHPTSPDQVEFVTYLRLVTGKKASNEYGTRRSAILSMVLREAGYGFTRSPFHFVKCLARYLAALANNAELLSWTLSC